MDIKTVKAIRKAYKSGKNHKQVIEEFNLTYAQEYAINCIGRDNNLTDEVIAEKIEGIKEGMLSGSIQNIMLT